MPPIKRYFPLDHDINSIPDCWAMTGLFGDRTMRLWLEFESQSDRNEGCLSTMSEAYARALAGRCQLSRTTVTRVWDWLVDRALITRDTPPRWVKYADFHKTGEKKKSQAENKKLPPNQPNQPNQPKEPAAAGLSSEEILGLTKELKLTTDQTQRVLQWVISMTRCMGGEPQERVIAVTRNSLAAFRERAIALGPQGIHSVWGLLTTIFTDERTKYMQGPEHEAHKRPIKIPTQVGDILRKLA